MARKTEFTFQEIQERHKADLWLPRYIVRHANLIVALRLREKFNPRIHDPDSPVWVGATPRVKTWGDRLSKSGTRLTLYVARTGNKTYTLKGDFRVNRNPSFTAAELAAARRKVPHDLSRIVFLRPA